MRVHVPHLPANMDPICWGKAAKAREPSNEHNPYALAVHSKQRTRPIRVRSAQECAGGSSSWLWLRHLPLHCEAKAPICNSLGNSCQYPRGGWGLGGYTSTGADTQQRLDHEELNESTQQEHDELYADMQEQLEEFLIMHHFSNLESLILRVQILMLCYRDKTNIF